jgi:hypothetical protein
MGAAEVRKILDMMWTKQKQFCRACSANKPRGGDLLADTAEAALRFNEINAIPWPAPPLRSV